MAARNCGTLKPLAGFARMTDMNATNYPLLAQPHIRLHGTVDDAMYDSFQSQLQAAPVDGPLVLTLTTLGGDPEMARAMGDDIRLLRDYTGREALFLGKVAVYSAGATLMSAFPVDKRFVTRGTRIMIHERQIHSSVDLAGPLKMQVANLKAKLHEIEHSVLIEEEGFRDLVAGSRVTFDEVCDKASDNWYISAEQARELGLILDII
jgi:ATP-dependent protease ClpP protease subunit